jgi:hypothetical protein
MQDMISDMVMAAIDNIISIRYSGMEDIRSVVAKVAAVLPTENTRSGDIFKSRANVGRHGCESQLTP